MATRQCNAAILTIVPSIFAIHGCTLPRATVPMRTIEIAAPDRGSDTLVVMLPGIGDRPELFLSSGFVDGFADDAFDLLAVDAHWRYYSNGSVVRRLREDVIEPARARGYRNIWLLGVSLGGYGSLLYVDRFPNDVAGIILLSPYLGGRRLLDRIDAAGGLTAWSGASRHPERFERGWRSLQRLCARDPSIVILGFGSADRLAARYGPLLEALQPSQVYTAEGGHEWTTWTPLWSEIKATVEIR
jgi:pimeloyl-ACP methyl ester carboxylesterase